MRIADRLDRFVAVGGLAAAVYAGYKGISLAESKLHIHDAEERRSRHHTWSANRFYHIAVTREGLLIKLGQIIGSRPDLIPDEYIDVLARLQDQVPPKPFPMIERAIARRLERPIADVFAEFDETPIASASLAQVHKGRLKDGRVVAVKVQYPGIEEIVRNDLRNVRLLLKILATFERNLDFGPIIEEISHNVPLELDFINEGHNAEIIARNFENRDDVIVPRIIWEYSTRRLLTMEFLDGIKITDLESMHRAGIDPHAVAQLVSDIYCEQLFLHGMFHADPHPGNLFVRAGPQLVLLDFGLCRQYDDKFRLGYAKLVESMLTWNVLEMVQAFQDLGVKVKHVKDPSVYLELGRAFMETSSPGKGYADRDLVAEANERMNKAIRANPIMEIPRELLLIMRVTGLLSGLGKHLDSRVNVVDTLLPYTRAALEGAK